MNEGTMADAMNRRNVLLAASIAALAPRALLAQEYPSFMLPPVTRLPGVVRGLPQVATMTFLSCVWKTPYCNSALQRCGESGRRIALLRRHSFRS